LAEVYRILLSTFGAGFWTVLSSS